MIKLLRPILYLALLYIVLGACMLPASVSLMNTAAGEAAREIIVISVIYFSYTLLEVIVAAKFSRGDSSYNIGVNLGFSLLRLFLTLGILFAYKHTENIHFGTAFANVMVFYFGTLAYSTWHRRKLNR